METAQGHPKHYGFPAATGAITMGSEGDPIKDVIVMKYSDGSAVPVYTVSPARGESEEEKL